MSGELLLRFENLNVQLAGRMVLRGMNWRLHRGDRWLVTGPNGAGKSTFLRVARGETWPLDDGGQRVYTIDGLPETRSPVDALRRFAMVSPESQELYRRQGWAFSVREAVRAGVHQRVYTQGLLSADDEARVSALLEQYDLGHLAERPMTELSAGETRRALLARALASRPTALLLDEAMNGLDAHARDWLLGEVARLADGGLTVIMTAHRPEDVPAGAWRFLRIDGGRIAEVEAMPPLEEVEPRIAVGPRSQPADVVPLVHLAGCDVYRERRLILADVRWELWRGRHWLVGGCNGAGKSTFLRLVAGEEYPAWGGLAEWFGRGEEMGLAERRRRIALVSAEMQADYDREVSGAEVVYSAWHGSIGLPLTAEQPSAAQQAEVLVALRRVDALHLAERDFSRLSYGERRRLLLARALVLRPEVLLLDEPYNGLDPHTRHLMESVVEDLVAEGATVVLTTHHESEVPRFITDRLLVRDGRLVLDGASGVGASGSKFVRRGPQAADGCDTTRMHDQWNS